jgi:hypothetical protein
MSVTGHKTLAEVQRHTKAASRAVWRRPRWGCYQSPKPEQKLSQLETRLRKARRSGQKTEENQRA